MMTDWPAVPSKEEQQQALTYDQFISQNVAPPPRADRSWTSQTPMAEKADLDLTPLLLPNVKFKKLRMQDLVTALWTVKHSALFHEAVGKLFTQLDMNRVHEGPHVPVHLLELPHEERRAMAIQEFMHSAAEFGENPFSIGITWTHPAPEQPGRSAHQFRMLPRNPAWMGFSAHLPLVKDCYFLICPAKNSRKVPGHAVGYPASPEALESLKD